MLLLRLLLLTRRLIHLHARTHVQSAPNPAVRVRTSNPKRVAYVGEHARTGAHTRVHVLTHTDTLARDMRSKHARVLQHNACMYICVHMRTYIGVSDFCKIYAHTRKHTLTHMYMPAHQTHPVCVPTTHNTHTHASTRALTHVPTCTHNIKFAGARSTCTERLTYAACVYFLN